MTQIGMCNISHILREANQVVDGFAMFDLVLTLAVGSFIICHISFRFRLMRTLLGLHSQGVSSLVLFVVCGWV